MEIKFGAPNGARVDWKNSGGIVVRAKDAATLYIFTELL